MRRIITCLAIATALLAAPTLALAAEEAKPADAKPADTTATATPTSSTTSTTSSSTSSSAPTESSGDMSGGMHDGGGLFDNAEHTRKHGISAFALVPYDYGFGLGFALRYTLPIVPNGFISKLNDSFEVEMGADLSYSWYGYFGANYGYLSLVIPAAEARWSFHFTKRWEAYAKAGLGFRWRNYDSPYGHSGAMDWVYINVGVGGLMHINDVFAIRAEIGYGGLRVGMGFSF
ncbi:MAG: hypothetical protein QM765_15270 [Myxococcales bacterium]